MKIIKKLWPTRFATAKAAHFGPVGKWIEKMFFHGDQMIQIPINEDIQGAEQSVALPLSVLEEFVREASTRFIMHECICRDNSCCKDYPVHTGCVFLGEAARDINPKLGKQTGAEETLEHIRDATHSGLVPFTGRNKLDTFWLGVGPGHRLMTICLCCPCCCLYNVYPHLPAPMRKGVVKLEGLEVEISEDCIGCGHCETVCVSRAIRVRGKQAEIDPDSCFGCGRCASECPEGAVELRITKREAIEAWKKRIRSVVDVS